MDQSIDVWEISAKRAPVSIVLQARSLDELSHRLPSGLYTTFRTFANGTRALDLKHHLDRLYLPAAGLGVQPALTRAELRRALAELLAARRPSGGAPMDEARVRVSLATGQQAGALFVAIEPFKGPSREDYQRGVRVVTSALERADPALKSTAFLEKSIQERTSLAEAGAFEALMVHAGRILEGLSSNFYYIQEGALGTARRGVLPGVTRRLVLRLARAQGLPVRYRPLALDDLADIAEAFITSSSRGIVPVVRIDNTPVGPGKPGPLTRLLMERYGAYVEARAELIMRQ